MDVQIFTWARHAEMNADGSLTLVGAGKEKHVVLALPLSFPLLYLVARLTLNRKEALEPHKLQFVIGAPNADVFFQSEEFVVQDPAIADQHEYLTVHTVLMLANIVFGGEGYYRMQLKLDGETVKDCPMSVQVQPLSGETSPLDTKEG